MDGQPPGAERRARERRESRLVGQLIVGMDEEDVALLGRAAELRAVVLEHLDGQYPDPERRRHAARLRALSLLLWRANAARDAFQEHQEKQGEPE